MKQPKTHPDWCNQARCHAHLHQLGEHRSEPLSINPGRPGGRLVATRVQTGQRHYLEITVVAPLLAPAETGRAVTAQLVLDGLTYALTRAIGPA